MKLFFRKTNVGTLVSINSNCPNTRKAIYKVYAVLETAKGIGYVLENPNNHTLLNHLFSEEEMVIIK